MFNTYANGDIFSSENPAPKHTTLTYCKDLKTRTLHIELDIPDSEFLSIKTDEFTRRLIYECEKSTKISDKLLVLEHVVRLIENELE